jgi:hypothetical protein
MRTMCGFHLETPRCKQKQSKAIRVLRCDPSDQVLADSCIGARSSSYATKAPLAARAWLARQAVVRAVSRAMLEAKVTISGSLPLPPGTTEKTAGTRYVSLLLPLLVCVSLSASVVVCSWLYEWVSNRKCNYTTKQTHPALTT